MAQPVTFLSASIMQLENLTGDIDILQHVIEDHQPTDPWMVAISNQEDTRVIVRMPKPPGPLTGQQQIRAIVRRNLTGSGSGGTPTVDLLLRQHGAPIMSLVSQAVAGTDEPIVVGQFDASVLDGNDEVEVEIHGIATTTGPPPQRRTVDISCIEWNASLTDRVVSLVGVPQGLNNPFDPDTQQFETMNWVRRYAFPLEGESREIVSNWDDGLRWKIQNGAEAG